MSIFSFQLPVVTTHRFVRLRELTGHEELLFAEQGTRGALALLNQLIVNSGKPVSIEKVPIANRDYLLAGIYKYTYGERIESVVHCKNCSEPYDLRFSLVDLIKHVYDSDTQPQPDADGFFNMNGRARFRLPDGEDELAVWELAPEEAGQVLLQRCLPEPVSPAVAIEIQEAMERTGPVLLTDMSTTCPECKTEQTVRFDMQSFLFIRIKNERKNVIAEMHRIASAYGWSHQEILDLPHILRQSYANLIGGN